MFRVPMILLATCGIALLPQVQAGALESDRLAEPNPFLGPVGTATMHGDAGSSDATPLPGPTTISSVSAYPLAAACPTLLEGSDRLVVALCTTVAERSPIVHLIDPDAPGPLGAPLASLSLAKGGLLGGVYAYLDNDDRLVAVDGRNRLLRVEHTRDAAGKWQLYSTVAADLGGVLAPGDSVAGLVADWVGNVWFASARGVVGLVRPNAEVARLTLPGDEQVANSISAAPTGRISVATTHALYEFAADASGSPQVLWRAPYDRGSARKPGQLSWGTGSTPTYFGPRTGAEYLTMVDNADGRVHLLVFHSGTGELVCSVPVLTDPAAGSENSPIGVGNSVYVASTYGYPYPAVPEGAGAAVPSTAPFVGGMNRVDVSDAGCRPVWINDVRSAAVPHLSTADNAVYTVERQGAVTTTPLDGFEFTAIDPATGAVRSRHPLPGAVVNDPLQTSPLITHGRRILQGTVTGILRLE